MPRANPFTATPVAVLAAILWAVSGCGDAPVERRDDASPETVAADSSRNIPGRAYERRFVFTTPDPDSTLIVPLFFSARTVPGGVDRAVRGWLHRNGDWETFVEERWSTPPSRAPWRILPRGPLRLVVGEQDAIQTVIYGSGSRSLELGPEASLVEWSGPRSETILLQEGSLTLSGQTFSGFLLDMTRARPSAESSHGDWAFLVSGDSLQVVLSSSSEGPDDGPGAAHGFGRLDFRDIRWPDVSVEWSETRSFEPARRTVPITWRISTPTEDLRGTVTSESAELEAGGGAGPVLPVSGLYAVSGTLRVQGAEYPVRGLVRHRRD